MKKDEDKSTTPQITKDTLITTAMEKCPEALGIFFEHGLHCVGCGGAAFETIEQGCQVHGMSEAEIEGIVEEINSAMKKKKK
jgi:hybrid cluster-associated redox disulfide protein